MANIFNYQLAPAIATRNELRHAIPSTFAPLLLIFHFRSSDSHALRGPRTIGLAFCVSLSALFKWLTHFNLFRLSRSLVFRSISWLQINGMQFGWLVDMRDTIIILRGTPASDCGKAWRRNWGCLNCLVHNRYMIYSGNEQPRWIR